MKNVIIILLLDLLFIMNINGSKLHVKNWEKISDWKPLKLNACDDIEKDQLCVKCPFKPFENYAKGLSGRYGFKVLITLNNGLVGMFKPHSYDRPFVDNAMDDDLVTPVEEIVAFHLSEELGFNHVLPSIIIHIPFECYRKTFEEVAMMKPQYSRLAERVNEMIHKKDGFVAGSLEHYLEEKLEDVTLSYNCGEQLDDSCTDEDDIFVKTAVFDYFIGNGDRYTGGNFMYYIDKNDNRKKHYIWLDHDGSDVARPYSALPIYTGDESEGKMVYWNLQSKMVKARLQMRLGKRCLFPSSVLNSINRYKNDKHFSKLVATRLRQAGVRIDEEHEQRLALKYSVFQEHLESCKHKNEHNEL